MSNLNQKEFDQYDRQIRIWGAQTQKKIIESSVLICNCTLLNIEIAKNLVLAGVQLTIQDDKNVTKDDIQEQYALTESDLGKPRSECICQYLQQLNQSIQIHSMTKSIYELNNDDIKQFNVLCIGNINLYKLNSIYCLCESNNCPLFITEQYSGINFIISFQYTIQWLKKIGNSQSYITTTFPSLSSFLLLSPVTILQQQPKSLLWYFKLLQDNEYLSINENIEEEIVSICKQSNIDIQTFNTYKSLFSSSSFIPVAAITAGIGSQYIIRYISKEDEPLYNCFEFDCINMNGKISTLQ
ncbi:hypothetical protein WA158_007725 [Blastocystis sp. Blastoise]